MNDLDTIRAFAGLHISLNKPAASRPACDDETYPAALQSLAQSSKWLRDQSLVDRVVSRLDAIEPQSAEARAQTASIYMKLMRPNTLCRATHLTTTRIKMSDQESIDLPKRLLMAESAVFQRELGDTSIQTIDWSGKASKESLAHLAAHLATGDTSFVSEVNAFELLLLAKEYELQDLAMKCLERVLGVGYLGMFRIGNGRRMSAEESSLGDLLVKANCHSISISRSAAGVAYVRMGGSARGEVERWECLMKLHHFFPVKHLELNNSQDLARLLDFTRQNPSIVSLSLGGSDDITDEYLEELAHNLSKLKSLSLRARKIKAIPQIICDQLVTLDCRFCNELKGLDVPNVVSLNCEECRTLVSINAPNAQTLVCNSCYALTSISADSVVTLDCGACYALTSLSANSAVTLNCSYCSRLTSLSADRVVTLDCRNCRVLQSIKAACAVTLDCHDCEDLVSINAPNVQTLKCSYCRALASVNAASVATLDCAPCPSLTSAIRVKLFHIVRRNIILTNYRDIEKLVELLTAHFTKASTTYKLGVDVGFPLHTWFLDAKEFGIPPDFDSDEEKLQCQQKIAGFFERLVTIAANERTLQRSNLNWFTDLKQLNSPQQQMNRIIWLGSLLGGIIEGENPLEDPKALQTLKAIGNLGNPLLQEEATRALFSMYHSEASGQKGVWMSLMENKPDHLLLLCLFIARTDFNIDTTNQMLEGLKTKYYMDYRVLNPIAEMVYVLLQDPYVTVSEREKIFQMVLTAPQKMPRENAKSFAERIREYKIEQPKWVNACRDLLLFEKAAELKTVQNVESLLDGHSRACQVIFGVKDQFITTFIDAFKSKRYPNGLFTYAARLQTLPETERAHLTTLLGQFVNGYLESAFPNSRYDLSTNVHLKTVFMGNDLLFGKWKEPLEIDLGQIESMRQGTEIPPRDDVGDLMAQAIRNGHLGEDQDQLYPTLVLVAALGPGGLKEVQADVSALEKRLNDTKEQQKIAPPGKQIALKKIRNHLEIETLCLQALDPQVELVAKEELLRSLLEKLPESVELKNDVRGMLSALSLSKATPAKWVKLQTTEEWEDLLLMGTEVINSCQRIDGDPKYNKCLLAYILDGKNKLVIVRGSDGKIAARSVLRILWDGAQKSPVLFMEQIYTATVDPVLPRLIIDACMKKAGRMGLPLVASPSSFPTGERFKGSLSALGGPAPYEYVDALSSVQTDGQFTITVSNIVYTPGAEPTSSRVSGLQA